MPATTDLAGETSVESRRLIGVVLAGGPSSRLGTDKSKLVIEVDGQRRSLVDWAAERLAAVTSEVVVASRSSSADEAREERWQEVTDGPGRGPGAGILGAAAARPGASLLVLACDQPLVPVAVLARIAGPACRPVGSEEGRPRPGGSSADDWRLPASRSGLEPTCALYSPLALAALARRVARGRYDLHGLAEDRALRIRRLDERDLGCRGRWRQVFLNLNEPRDLERLAAFGLSQFHLGSLSLTVPRS